MLQSGFQTRHGGVDVLEQQYAPIGELQCLWTALKQRHPKVGFQGSDLVTDCRGAQAELFARGFETQFPSHNLKCL
jgi:hypothetical protein